LPNATLAAMRADGVAEVSRGHSSPCSGRRAEHDDKMAVWDFGAMMQQKTEQLGLDFGDMGEARKRWSKGRLVSPADEPGRRKPVEPVLAEGLIEAMVSGKNADAALSESGGKQGRCWCGGIRTEELRAHLMKHWRSLKQELLDGKYRPKPVRRVGIPKPEGGMRELGIPTVLDRFIQQMILQALEPLYEPTFSESSYGFRRGRSAKRRSSPRGSTWRLETVG